MKNLIYHRKSLVYATLLFLLISALSGCKKSSDNSPAQGANEVWIQNMAFSPATITVSVNTTVKWTNKDAIAHTVTSTTGLFDSGSISSNGTYSHQFTTAGTYPYLCTIHPNMTAKVIVQ
jgi:plastocyanin